jgi:hypothetical protein
MKIKKSELKALIREEAIKLHYTQQLNERKAKIENMINLISEGREDEVNEEELNELLGGLGRLAASSAKAIGGAVKSAGQAIGSGAQQVGQKISNTAQKAGQAVGGAMDKAGQAVGGAMDKAGQAVGGAIDKAGQAVGDAAKGIKNTYNKGELEATVKKINDLNDYYKKLTGGKSYVGKFNAVANPTEE